MSFESRQTKQNEDDNGDIMLNDKTGSYKDSLECKCLISWTTAELEQFIKTLSNIPPDSQQLLISRINENQINGFEVDKCKNADDLQYLFKLCSPENYNFFTFLFNKLPNGRTQKAKRKNSLWDKHVFNWNSNDVKNWILSLGENMSQYADCVTNLQVNGLFLILHLLDPNGRGSANQFLTCFPASDSAFLLHQAQELRKKYNITDEEFTNKKKESQFGLIGLSNQGNTCFMNAAIQLILQTPGIYGIYQQFKFNYNGNVHVQDLEYSKWDPRHYMSHDHKNENKTNKHSIHVSMINCLIELHSKSRNHRYNCFKPVSIFNRICQIDSKYRKKRQQDCAAVMSLMLQDIDQNLNNQVINESARARDEKEDIAIDHDIPFSSTIVVKQELTKQQQEMLIHEKLLKKHNPFNTIIRQTMDGVQKIVSICIDCNWRRIEYETFRSIKLPLINNEISINIEIYIPNRKNTIKHVFKVENYTKIYVLKHQIAQLILNNYKTDNINNNISMDSIVIVSILPYYMNRNQCNNNNNNNNCIDDWIVFYDSNENCSTLSPAINLFATIQYDQHSKLITILNVKIDENERVIYDGIRFAEFEIKQNFEYTYTGSRLLNSIVGGHTQNKNNICMSLRDRIVHITDDTKYTFGSKTNVLILIEMANDELTSKLFPFSQFNTNNGVEQWIIEDCINRYNLRYNKRKNYVKHISLSVIINDLSERLKHSNCNNNLYIQPLQNVLRIIQTEDKSTKNIIQYLHKYFSTNNKNVIQKPILNDIYDCISEYEREKILDCECSQLYCKKCGKKPKIFCEKVSIVYSPLNLTFRIERGNGTQRHNDKFNHLVKYPYENALILSNGDQYNLYGVGIHSSWNTLEYGHYIAYIKSIYNSEWYEISDSSIHRVEKSTKIQNKEAIILMYTKSK